MKKIIIIPLFLISSIIFTACGGSGQFASLSDEDLYQEFCVDKNFDINDLESESANTIYSKVGDKEFEMLDGMTRFSSGNLSYVTLYDIAVNTDMIQCEYPDWSEVGEYSWIELSLSSDTKEDLQLGEIYTRTENDFRGSTGTQSTNYQFPEAEMAIDALDDELVEGRMLMCGETYEDGFAIGNFSIISCK